MLAWGGKRVRKRVRMRVREGFRVRGGEGRGLWCQEAVVTGWGDGAGSNLGRRREGWVVGAGVNGVVVEV